MTDEVVNAMTITASPLFEGDLVKKLSEQIDISFNIDKSIFTDRLNISTPCQTCDYKKTGHEIRIVRKICWYHQEKFLQNGATKSYVFFRFLIGVKLRQFDTKTE